MQRRLWRREKENKRDYINEIFKVFNEYEAFLWTSKYVRDNCILFSHHWFNVVPFEYIIMYQVQNFKLFWMGQNSITLRYNGPCKLNFPLCNKIASNNLILGMKYIQSSQAWTNLLPKILLIGFYVVSLGLGAGALRYTTSETHSPSPSFPLCFTLSCPLPPPPPILFSSPSLPALPLSFPPYLVLHFMHN